MDHECITLMDIYVAHYKDDGDTRGVCFRFLLCNDGCFICIYLDVLIHLTVLVSGAGANPSCVPVKTGSHLWTSWQGIAGPRRTIDQHPRDNFEFPFHLTCMCLHFGRKAGESRQTH